MISFNNHSFNAVESQNPLTEQELTTNNTQESSKPLISGTISYELALLKIESSRLYRQEAQNQVEQLRSNSNTSKRIVFIKNMIQQDKFQGVKPEFTNVEAYKASLNTLLASLEQEAKRLDNKGGNPEQFEINFINNQSHLTHKSQDLSFYGSTIELNEQLKNFLQSCSLLTDHYCFSSYTLKRESLGVDIFAADKTDHFGGKVRVNQEQIEHIKTLIKDHITYADCKDVFSKLNISEWPQYSKEKSGQQEKQRDLVKAQQYIDDLGVQNNQILVKLQDNLNKAQNCISKAFTLTEETQECLGEIIASI